VLDGGRPAVTHGGAVDDLGEAVAAGPVADRRRRLAQVD
jgi:hypothetical protein